MSAELKGHYMTAFGMPRAYRRNLVRQMPGGIKLWRTLPLMKMTRRIGTKVVMTGARRIMPWEDKFVKGV